MKNSLIILISIGMTFAINGFAFAANFSESEIVFNPHGETKNPITIKFYGKLYKDKSSFAKLKSDGVALGEEEKFVIKIIDINTRGDKRELLSLWRPQERAALEPKINDPELYGKNVSLYKNVLSSRFVAMMQYGDYILCFVEHDLRGAGSYIKMYPIVRDNNKLYMTNKLAGDFFYENFAFQLGEYLKKTR